MKTKTTRARRSNQPARKRKQRPIRNGTRAAWRFAKRVPWISLTLCAAAFLALVLVETSVAGVIGHMATDPITAVIFVASAVLASLGVVFGPMAVRSIHVRAVGQRKFAWRIVALCFVLSIWNLSTTLANAQAQMEAHAVRSAPSYAQEVARLTALNASIDSLADEASAYNELQTDTAERDRLQERLDRANPRPIMFAWANDGWMFWLKAGLFHTLVAGFSTAFAFQMATKRRAKTKTKAPANWPYVADEPLTM